MPAWFDERFAAWVQGTAAAGAAPTFFLGRWLFLRGLGLIALIAFVSFWVQWPGLIGSHGILPANPYLRAVQSHAGPDRYWRFPTVFWLDAGDPAFHVVCGLGVVCALLLTAGVAPRLNLALIWLLYLSLSVAGQDFMSFQWDTLLTETCLLAVFIAPPGWRPDEFAGPGISPLSLFLLWWLLFRLMFESGIVKLTSGDPTWRHLTALNYHYFTQPLPTAAAWYFNALPGWFQKLSVLVIYAVELGCPFLICLPPGRGLAAAGIVALMLLIMLTGNYNFFNLLTIVLALLLIEDRLWARLLPRRALEWIGYAPVGHPGLPAVWTAVLLGVAVVYAAGGALQVWQACAPRAAVPYRAGAWLDALAPWRSLNGYGLFRVMTTARPEIVVEGSDDGVQWRAYEFKYKPGDPRRRPTWVAPHQPRLDWQMWFAALESYAGAPWFRNFLVRLLQGEPAVLRLLAHNPFPDHPPRYIRAQRYDYRFTTPAERRADGAWWRRDDLGPYAPAASLSPPAP